MFASCASVPSSMSTPHSGQPASTLRRCHSPMPAGTAPARISVVERLAACSAVTCRSKAGVGPRSASCTTRAWMPPISSSRCVKRSPCTTGSISSGTSATARSTDTAPSPTSVRHDIAIDRSVYFTVRGFTYFRIIAAKPTPDAAFASTSRLSTTPLSPGSARMRTSAMMRPFTVRAQAYCPSPPSRPSTSFVTSPVSDSAALGPVNCMSRRSPRSMSSAGPCDVVSEVMTTVE